MKQAKRGVLVFEDAFVKGKRRYRYFGGSADAVWLVWTVVVAAPILEQHSVNSDLDLALSSEGPHGRNEGRVF